MSDNPTDKRPSGPAPSQHLGFAARHSQQAYVQGLDGAGMAYALRALEEADAQKASTLKPNGFAARELERRQQREAGKGSQGISH